MTVPHRRSLAGRGETTLVERKSRFIGIAYPLTSAEQAQESIAQIQRQYWDASHVCYAFVLGMHHETQRSSDAGEPSGTAGRPLLNALLKSSLSDACVVVVRYFGGTLLGVGGLIRAYGTTGQAALSAAGIVTYLPYHTLIVTADYSMLGALRQHVTQLDWPIANIEFSEEVRLTVLVPPGHDAEASAEVAGVTAGRARMEWGAVVERVRAGT